MPNLTLFTIVTTIFFSGYAFWLLPSSFPVYWMFVIALGLAYVTALGLCFCLLKVASGD